MADARAAGLARERTRARLATCATRSRWRAASRAPGAVVLLSPAAPSYDHYRDFEERGELFAELARAAPPRS